MRTQIATIAREGEAKNETNREWEFEIRQSRTTTSVVLTETGHFEKDISE
jgi:hypothetical protein